MLQVINLKSNYWCLIFITVCFGLSTCLNACFLFVKDESDIPDNSEIKSVDNIQNSTDETSILSEKTTINYDYIKGIWVSQFDMQPIFCNKGVQRDKESYIELVNTMLANIKKDSFNTIFLQLRPNGDSMYKSKLYPVSKYISGSYGNDITYDAVEIFIEKAHEFGLSVQGWINPLRLMRISEIEVINKNYLITQWFMHQNGMVVAVGDRLYLNPAYKEVRQLIIDGAAEIMSRYDIDGIHMDDYFYPTTEESFDEKEFSASGFDNLGYFRRDNINLLIKGLYKAVKNSDSSAQYGIAPAGNLYSLRDNYYVDVYLWCSQSGYIDYIMPQLYFGFLNRYCPFDKVLSEWADIVSEPSVRLIVGLTAAKSVLAVSGEIDVFAGSEEGKNEWIKNKDVLRRSLLEIYNEEKTDGYCFFCYQYLYDVLTGELNLGFAQEKVNIQKLLKYND